MVIETICPPLSHRPIAYGVVMRYKCSYQVSQYL